MAFACLLLTIAFSDVAKTARPSSLYESEVAYNASHRVGKPVRIEHISLEALTEEEKHEDWSKPIDESQAIADVADFQSGDSCISLVKTKQEEIWPLSDFVADWGSAAWSQKFPIRVKKAMKEADRRDTQMQNLLQKARERGIETDSDGIDEDRWKMVMLDDNEEVVKDKDLGKDPDEDPSFWPVTVVLTRKGTVVKFALENFEKTGNLQQIIADEGKKQIDEFIEDSPYSTLKKLVLKDSAGKVIPEERYKVDSGILDQSVATVIVEMLRKVPRESWPIQCIIDARQVVGERDAKEFHKIESYDAWFNGVKSAIEKQRRTYYDDKIWHLVFLDNAGDAVPKLWDESRESRTAVQSNKWPVTAVFFKTEAKDKRGVHITSELNPVFRPIGSFFPRNGGQVCGCVTEPINQQAWHAETNLHDWTEINVRAAVQRYFFRGPKLEGNDLDVVRSNTGQQMSLRDFWALPDTRSESDAARLPDTMKVKQDLFPIQFKKEKCPEIKTKIAQYIQQSVGVCFVIKIPIYPAPFLRVIIAGGGEYTWEGSAVEKGYKAAKLNLELGMAFGAGPIAVSVTFKGTLQVSSNQGSDLKELLMVPIYGIFRRHAKDIVDKNSPEKLQALQEDVTKQLGNLHRAYENAQKYSDRAAWVLKTADALDALYTHLAIELLPLIRETVEELEVYRKKFFDAGLYPTPSRFVPFHGGGFFTAEVKKNLPDLKLAIQQYVHETVGTSVGGTKPSFRKRLFTGRIFRKGTSNTNETAIIGEQLVYMMRELRYSSATKLMEKFIKKAVNIFFEVDWDKDTQIPPRCVGEFAGHKKIPNEWLVQLSPCPLTPEEKEKLQALEEIEAKIANATVKVAALRDLQAQSERAREAFEQIHVTDPYGCYPLKHNGRRVDEPLTKDEALLYEPSERSQVPPESSSPRSANWGRAAARAENQVKQTRLFHVKHKPSVQIPSLMICNLLEGFRYEDKDGDKLEFIRPDLINDLFEGKWSMQGEEIDISNSLQPVTILSQALRYLKSQQLDSAEHRRQEQYLIEDFKYEFAQIMVTPTVEETPMRWVQGQALDSEKRRNALLDMINRQYFDAYGRRPAPDDKVFTNFPASQHGPEEARKNAPRRSRSLTIPGLSRLSRSSTKDNKEMNRSDSEENGKKIIRFKDLQPGLESGLITQEWFPIQMQQEYSQQEKDWFKLVNDRLKEKERKGETTPEFPVSPLLIGYQFALLEEYIRALTGGAFSTVEGLKQQLHQGRFHMFETNYIAPEGAYTRDPVTRQAIETIETICQAKAWILIQFSRTNYELSSVAQAMQTTYVAQRAEANSDLMRLREEKRTAKGELKKSQAADAFDMQEKAGLIDKITKKEEEIHLDLKEWWSEEIEYNVQHDLRSAITSALGGRDPSEDVDVIKTKENEVWTVTELMHNLPDLDKKAIESKFPIQVLQDEVRYEVLLDKAMTRIKQSFEPLLGKEAREMDVVWTNCDPANVPSQEWSGPIDCGTKNNVLKKVKAILGREPDPHDRVWTAQNEFLEWSELEMDELELNRKKRFPIKVKQDFTRNDELMFFKQLIERGGKLTGSHQRRGDFDLETKFPICIIKERKKECAQKAVTGWLLKDLADVDKQKDRIEKAIILQSKYKVAAASSDVDAEYLWSFDIQAQVSGTATEGATTQSCGGAPPFATAKGEHFWMQQLKTRLDKGKYVVSPQTKVAKLRALSLGITPPGSPVSLSYRRASLWSWNTKGAADLADFKAKVPPVFMRKYGVNTRKFEVSINLPASWISFGSGVIGIDDILMAVNIGFPVFQAFGTYVARLRQEQKKVSEPTIRLKVVGETRHGNQMLRDYDEKKKGMLQYLAPKKKGGRKYDFKPDEELGKFKPIQFKIQYEHGESDDNHFAFKPFGECEESSKKRSLSKKKKKPPLCGLRDFYIFTTVEEMNQVLVDGRLEWKKEVFLKIAKDKRTEAQRIHDATVDSWRRDDATGSYVEFRSVATLSDVLPDQTFYPLMPGITTGALQVELSDEDENQEDKEESWGDFVKVVFEALTKHLTRRVHKCSLRTTTLFVYMRAVEKTLDLVAHNMSVIKNTVKLQLTARIPLDKTKPIQLSSSLVVKSAITTANIVKKLIDSFIGHAVPTVDFTFSKGFIVDITGLLMRNRCLRSLPLDNEDIAIEKSDVDPSDDSWLPEPDQLLMDNTEEIDPDEVNLVLSDSEGRSLLELGHVGTQSTGNRTFLVMAQGSMQSPKELRAKSRVVPASRHS